jgi:hypothetical protein
MTLHRVRLGAGILLVSGIFGVTSALAGPSMSTRWDSMTKSQDDCLDAAKQAVRGAGFTKNFEAPKTTVYGERGEYTAAVRCASEKEIVFFVVAGPAAETASKYNADIEGRV